MYWRVQKINKERIIRHVIIPVAMILSLALNFIVISSNSKKKSKLTQVQQETFKSLAKNVTIHFLDTSYINYKQNTFALLRELAPSLVQKLKASEELPATDQQLELTAQEYATKKRVSAIRIDSINEGEPEANGFVPVDVSGITVVSSADEADSSDPRPFYFRYLIGMIKVQNPDAGSDEPEVKRGHGGFNSLVSEPKQEDNLVPVVVDIQDLSNTPQGQGH